MRDMYESDLYLRNNPTWHEEDAPWKAAHIERMLRKNKTQAATIAEVGCGTGDVILNLAAAFPDAICHGFEISPAAFARAKAKETSRTSFSLTDLTAQTDRTFDVVLAIDVFEHVEDYMVFLKKLRPVGAYKIFHIPLDLSVQSVFRSKPIMNLRANVGHIHYFYKETALAALTDCGYEIVDFSYTASRLELPNQSFSSRLMRLPRRLAFALNKDFAVRLLGGYSLLVLAR
jgi:cyclopropane fatty-acyl-phospholipid synthase-like methyltransferase